ncbi:hypothetical protein [Trujillonella humicola]|uniref:hypothetical protein n=1 Tax=Trujillonella humicola TaxID=3383699 RepID=UPI0039068FA5
MSDRPHDTRILQATERLRARLATRRRAPERWRGGPPWWPVALVVALLLITAGVVVLVPGDGGPANEERPLPTAPTDDATGPDATPGDPAPQPACRSGALVQVHAPAPDAQLRPGHVLVTGTTADPDRSLRWTVSRAPAGTQVTSGFVQPSDLGAGSAWSTVVELAPGAYEFTVSLVGDGSVADPCATAGTSFSLAGSVTGPTWRSGASGNEVPTGEFAAWRGTDLPIAGAWADSNQGQLALWQVRPDGQYGGWTADLDYAIGAIERHESWAAAARGAYDARWTRSLQELARSWEGRPGTLYLRLAHEFNGTWFPWSVTAGESADFVAAWQRFRALQLTWFPAARLVFTPNYETPAEQRLDWRTFFPGPEYVDVISIPYFNAWPYVDTPEEFWQRAFAVDSFGAPSGIHRHLEFARSVGLPLAVSEWGPHARFGDAGVYVEEMNQYFRITAGDGPGQLLYEILFNVPIDGNAFALMPATRSPIAADRYRELW